MEVNDGEALQASSGEIENSVDEPPAEALLHEGNADLSDDEVHGGAEGAEDAGSDTYKGYASAAEGSSAEGSASDDVVPGEVPLGEVRLRGLVKRFSERHGWGLLAVIGDATATAADGGSFMSDAHKDVRFYRLDKDLLSLEIGDLLSFATTPDSTIKGWERAICIDREQPREGEDVAALLLQAASRPKVKAPKPAPEPKPEPELKAKAGRRRRDLQGEVHKERPDAGGGGWSSRSYLAKAAAKSQATPLLSPMGEFSEDASLEWLTDLPAPSATPAATEESRIRLHAAAQPSSHRRILQRPAHETYHTASEDVPPPPSIENHPEFSVRGHCAGMAREAAATSTGWTAGGYLRREAAKASESEDDDKERPQTTSVVARRLVLSHLEVKLTRSKQNQERKFWGRKPVLGGMRADGFKDEEVEEYGPHRREKLDRKPVEPVRTKAEVAEVPMERSKRMFATAVQQAKGGERAVGSCGGDDDDLLWIRPGFAKKLEASRRKESPSAAQKADGAGDQSQRPERSEGRRAANPGRLFGQVLQRSVPKPVEAAAREPSPEASRAPARVQGGMRGWDDEGSSDSRKEEGRGPSHAGRGDTGPPWKAESSAWQGKSWRDGWESNTWDSRGWSNS